MGCSFNEITSIFKEKEVKLPGKRENVFDFKDDIIVKANKKFLLINQQQLILGANSFRIQKTTYSISEVNQS